RRERDPCDREQRAAVRGGRRRHEGNCHCNERAAEQIQNRRESPAELAGRGRLHCISSDWPPPGFIPSSCPLPAAASGFGVLLEREQDVRAAVERPGLPAPPGLPLDEPLPPFGIG